MLILQHTEIKFSSKVGKSVCTEILFVKTDERDREFSSCSVKCGQKVCFYREFFSVCPGSPNVKAQRAFVCPDSPSVKVYTASLVCTDSPNVKVYRTSLSRQSKHKGIQSIFYLSRQSKGKSIQISLSRQSIRESIHSILFVQTVKVYKESCVCPGSPTVKVYREPVANFSTLTKTKKLSAVFPLVNARFPSYKVFEVVQIKTELFVSVLQV